MTVAPIRDDLPPPPPEDGAELTEAIIYETDGRITLRFGGQEWRLRRPKYGEYVAYLEADERARPKKARKAVTDASAAFAQVVSDWKTAVTGEGGDLDKLDVGELARLASRLHTEQLKDQMGARSRNLAWWRLVCNGDAHMAGLSDHPLPESDDDCPLWLTNDQPAVDTIQHWLGVPTVAPGS